MSCLIILDLEDGLPNRPSLATITAARQISDEIDLLITDPEKYEKIKKIPGIRTILMFDKKKSNILAENFANFLKNITENYSYIMSPSGTFSKNFIPRLGAILDVQPISDVIRIHDKNTFDRPIYAGNAISKVRSKDPVIILTIRGTAFNPASYENGNTDAKS